MELPNSVSALLIAAFAILPGVPGERIYKVAASERDIVLREPSLYDETQRAYRTTSYETMFLLGSTIVSIAAIMDTQNDVRITPTGKALFGKATNNAE